MTTRNAPVTVVEVEPIKTRTLANGTVQHECQGPSCWGGRWFEPTRSDARYCSTNCRVAAYRDRKDRAEREAARIAHEVELARLVEGHRQRYVSWLTSNIARCTHGQAEKAYRDGMRRGLIPLPFPQYRLFD